MCSSKTRDDALQKLKFGILITDSARLFFIYEEELTTQDEFVSTS